MVNSFWLAASAWAARNGVELRFIQPGKPVRNVYIESCSSRFRDACLSQHLFASLSHTRSVIDNWREDYNHHRTHSTLGYVPPAVFAARCRPHAGGSAPNPASTSTMQTPGLWIEALRNLGAAQTRQRSPSSHYCVSFGSSDAERGCLLLRGLGKP